MRRVWTFAVAGMAAMGCAASAQAELYLGSGGRPGSSATSEPARCKYNRTVTAGSLAVTVDSPTITGANLRRGRRDVTKARFRAYLTDAYSGGNIQQTGWSSWIRLSDRQRARWGSTSFTMDWRNAYVVDLRIEWWRSGRMRGWRAQRLNSYNYVNHYNLGPFGPFDRCAWWGL